MGVGVDRWGRGHRGLCVGGGGWGVGVGRDRMR